MNSKTIKRAVVAYTSALGVIGILFTILEMFSVDAFGVFRRAAASSVVVLILLLIVLFVLAGAFGYAFYLAVYGEKALNARMVTLKGTEDDVVFIKQETMEAYVASVVGKPEGVSDISVTAKYLNMALEVTVSISVNMDVDIASMTSEMQKKLREQIESVNGIKLSRVAVIISGIIVPEKTEGMKMPWTERLEEIKKEQAEAVQENSEEAVESEENIEDQA